MKKKPPGQFPGYKDERQSTRFGNWKRTPSVAATVSPEDPGNTCVVP